MTNFLLAEGALERQDSQNTHPKAKLQASQFASMRLCLGVTLPSFSFARSFPLAN